MNNKVAIQKIVLSGLFIALGWLLPFVTLGIPYIGKMLLPMHIPVFLAGFILGPKLGSIIGLIIPLTRSLFFSQPVFYPFALCMSLELFTYGLVSGLLFHLFKKNNREKIIYIYISLLSSMIVGRLVWACTRFICGLIDTNMFTFKIFIASGFVEAWPGIVIQLLIIPLVVKVLDKQKILSKLNKGN